MKIGIVFLLSLLTFNCSTKNNINVKELVIGCFPHFIKNPRNPIEHKHEENWQETMNIEEKYIYNNEEVWSKPTYVKDIRNIQTENKKEETTYMTPDTFDRVYLEGLPQVDSSYITHENVFKLLKKGGELHIQECSAFPNCILKNKDLLIGPFLWEKDNITLNLPNSFKFEKESKDLKSSESFCGHFAKIFRDYVGQPVYNAFSYGIPSFNIHNMNDFFVKRGKREFFQCGIAPILYAISYWLSGHDKLTFELNNNVGLEDHKKNSQNIIIEYFNSLGYSKCVFKYHPPSEKDKNEYGYEIIVTK